jgi:hypothetical protein
MGQGLTLPDVFFFRLGAQPCECQVIVGFVETSKDFSGLVF